MGGCALSFRGRSHLARGNHVMNTADSVLQPVALALISTVSVAAPPIVRAESTERVCAGIRAV